MSDPAGGGRSAGDGSDRDLSGGHEDGGSPAAATSGPGSVEIRPAVEDDLVVLADIEVAASQRFREVGLDAIADDDPPPLEDYRDAADDGLLWVAAADGTPVGYAWMLDLRGQPHLEQLTVHPAWQGLGIGTALVEVALDWARSLGAGSLSLSTFRDVPWNAPWYGARGFEVLPESAHGERFAALRRHETAQGIDVAPRVVMVRAL